MKSDSNQAPPGFEDMAKPIPVGLNPKLQIEIDGARVASALELATDEFKRLLDAHRIAQLCERGTGADAGLYRTTFYHGRKRVRLVVDREGRIVGALER